jgi:hypothetical protein
VKSEAYFIFIGDGLSILSALEDLDLLDFAKINILDDYQGEREDIRKIDYKEWVLLLEKCQRVVSWT